MRFIKIERRILRLIRNEFPVAYDPKASKKPLAIGERPLLTEEAIALKSIGAKPDEVRGALEKLMVFECIRKVPLLTHEEYKDQDLAGGDSVRHVPLPMHPGPRTGPVGYQITEHGQKVLDSFVWERIKRLPSTWALKLAEEKGHSIIAAGLGAVLYWLGMTGLAQVLR